MYKNVSFLETWRASMGSEWERENKRRKISRVQLREWIEKSKKKKMKKKFKSHHIDEQHYFVSRRREYLSTIHAFAIINRQPPFNGQKSEWVEKGSHMNFIKFFARGGNSIFQENFSILLNFPCFLEFFHFFLKHPPLEFVLKFFIKNSIKINFASHPNPPITRKNVEI